VVQRLQAAYVGLTVLLLFAAWQTIQVRYRFDGNWTGLFCSGDKQPLPPGFESTFRIRNSEGYDGQFYRYIAYDPFIRTELWRYMDGGGYRYRRLLVPLIGWGLARITPLSPDWGYVLTIWMFVGLGAYWLAALAEEYGRPAWWGFLFLIAPATLLAGDFLTVDVALAALAIAVVWMMRRERYVTACLMAACCPLIHDAGVVIPGALGLLFLIRRDLWRAAMAAASVIPAWLWFQYLGRAFPPVPGGSTSPLPFWAFQKVGIGILERMLHPLTYPFAPMTNLIIQALDFGAVLSILISLPIAILARQRMDFTACAGVLYVGLTLALSSPWFWVDPNGYARTYTALLLLAAIRGLETGRWAYIAPLVIVTLRVSLQQLSEAHEIWKRVIS
jgi:hypothetical protein